MARKMISKKRTFSLKAMPITKTKIGKKLIPVDSTKQLSNPNLIFQALWECLLEKDLDSFKEILRSHLEVVNKQKFSKKSKIPIRTLYRTLSPEGNPTLKSISNVIHALYAK